jgi:glycosyltransferase involved in cell wall biosynthesis
VALVADDTRADAHWRIVRPLTRLAEQGADASWCWLDDDELPTRPIGGAVVVLQRVTVKGRNRRQVNAWVDRLRAAGAAAIVYECDDDIFSPAYLDYIEQSGRIYTGDRAKLLTEAQAQLWAMQACDAVTVSTEPLATVARQYTDALVYTIPNAIDVEWYRDHLIPRPEWHPFDSQARSGQALTVGWAGGRRPESDLAPMAEAWGRIARRYPRVRFVVAGWQHDVIYQHVELDRIIRVPWREVPDYPPAYQTTIGCCIAPDNAFSRCKSPIKAWEYGLAGACVVASPALYRDCVSVGCQASDVDAWEWTISGLMDDDIARREYRDGLRWHVDEYHALSANLHRWAETYHAIAAPNLVAV